MAQAYDRDRARVHELHDLANSEAANELPQSQVSQVSEVNSRTTSSSTGSGNSKERSQSSTAPKTAAAATTGNRVGIVMQYYAHPTGFNETIFTAIGKNVAQARNSVESNVADARRRGLYIRNI